MNVIDSGEPGSPDRAAGRQLSPRRPEQRRTGSGSSRIGGDDQGDDDGYDRGYDRDYDRGNGRTRDMRLVLAAGYGGAVQAAAPTEAAFAWLPFLISFLRRRWPTMAATTAGCAVLALLYALTSTPQYTATTQLLVDIRRADLLSQQHQIQDAQTLNSELESRVEILRSEGLARQVVQHLGLQRSFAAKPGGPGIAARLRGWLQPSTITHTTDTATDTATEQLMRMTSVRRIGLTYVIEIAVTTTSALESAQLANALIDSYVTGQLSAQDLVTRQAGAWLQERLAELRDQAMAAGNAVEQYKAAKNIIGTDKGLLNEQQLTALNTQLVGALQRASSAKIRADRTAQMLNGDVLSAGLDSDLQSTVINTLRAAYLDDQQRAARWSAAYGAHNAQVVKLQGEMTQIDVAIRSELQRVAAAAQNEYDIAHADQLAIQGRLSAMVDSTVKTNSDRVQLSSLQSSADTYRSVYENFLNRYTQAVQDESFPVSEARVITAARPPLRKSAPHTTVLLAMSILLGMAAGFVIALAREMLDRRLRDDDELHAETGLACVGHLPRLALPLPEDGAGNAPVSSSTELRVMPAGPGILRSMIQPPDSAFVQVLRSLRVRLMRAGGMHHEIRLVGFVPSGRGGGSTTVAVNFAQVLAAGGHRTVLVDLDTEDDTLSRAMAPDAPVGLLDVLADDALLEGLIRRDETSGVDVLPLGGRRKHAPLRYTPMAAQRVFDALLSTYDYVVVDLPPLTPAVESHLLGNLLDALILVVDWGNVEKGELADNMRATALDPAKFVGALYNKVDFKEMRSYTASASSVAAA